MTLIERCVRLVTQIKWSSELATRVHAAGKISDRKEQVDLVRRKVQASLDRAIALREARIAFDLPPCRGTTEMCRAAAVRIRDNADPMEQRTDKEEAAWRKLTKAIEKSENSIEEAVKDGIDAARKTVSDLPLAALQAVALAARKEVTFDELRDCQAQLLGTSWHTKPALELRQILERRLGLLKGARTLTDIGAPDDVRLFLDLAGKGAATIDGLTPEIRRWLEGKGLLGNLRITLGAR